MTTIKIKGVKYNLKYTLRALFIYERVTGKVFSLNNTMDEFLFFYCILLANNKDAELTFDDFIDECDKNAKLCKQMNDFLLTEIKKQNLFEDEEDKKEGGKKK